MLVTPFTPNLAIDSRSPLVPGSRFQADIKDPGVAVVDRDSAKAYSDLIAVHISGTTGGLSYSEVSGKWMADGKPGPAADQNEPNSYDVRMTAFMGESLRGLLLNACAFGTIGSIAVLAAWVMLGLALVMLILTVLGFRHLRRTYEKEAIFEPAP